MKTHPRWKVSRALLGTLMAVSVAAAARADACAGDCDGGGVVTINELVAMVSVALGAQPLSVCAPGDRDGNGRITIDEIVGAVSFTLNACPAVSPSASRTPSATATRVTPSPSPTRTGGSTECPTPSRSSIIVYEDLRVDGEHDPVVNLANVSRSLVSGRCFYADANGAGCTISEFFVTLSTTSSVAWQPRLGGIDTFGGSIPAVTTMPLRGELVCVEVDAVGFPLSGNHFAGTMHGTQECPFVASNLEGVETNDGDDVLCLGAEVFAQCPYGPEYDSCPAGLDPARIESCWSQSRFTFVCG